MKEWKTAAALLLTGAIVFMQGIVPTQAQVTAKAETLTYYETEDINDKYYGDDCTGSVTTACSYTITENQSWDDTLGEPVYDKYITIVNIDIIADVSVPTYLYTYADPYYASYGSIRYGSMDLYQSWIDWGFTLNYTIPAEIDGIPVRIIDASITYKTYGNSDRYPSVHVIVPEEIKTIQKLTDSDSFNPCCLHLPSTVQKIGTLHLENWNIEFDGTCAELFAAYPYIQEGDGKFICTDGKLYLRNSSTSISYDGTCAQWVEICPVNLVNCTASCSDGTIITEVDTTTTVPIATTTVPIATTTVPIATTTVPTVTTTVPIVTTTETTTTTTEIATEPPVESMSSLSTSATTSTTTVPTVTITVHFGDVDCNGNVNIMDVIFLNRNLMIGAPISLQGMINSDVDVNGVVDSVDSLNILKAVVQLITLPIA